MFDINHCKNINDTYGHQAGDVAQFEEYEDKLTLFEKVDKALYIAKNNGRDKLERSRFNYVHLKES